MSRRKVLFFLILIILLSGFLRLYKLDSAPPSLNWDEASIGYNAYSILKTGKDEWGKTFPLIFRAFGDYKLPGQIYLTVPFVWIFGLSVFAVRLPSAIAGIASVLFIYLLANELFKDKKIALISAFLLSISSWHIQLSRPSFESNLSTLLIIAGSFFFIKGIDSHGQSPWFSGSLCSGFAGPIDTAPSVPSKPGGFRFLELRKPWFLLLSTVLFIFSFYTYNSARLFTPLFFLTLIFLKRKDFTFGHRNFLIAFCLLVFFVSYIPILFSFNNGEGTARFRTVSFFDDLGVVNRINELRGQGGADSSSEKFFHNKLFVYTEILTRNYFLHFSPDFLFLSGGENKQYSIPSRGVMYFFELPFLMIGAYLLLKKKSNAAYLIVPMLLFAPIPSSLSYGSPNALRAMVMLPAMGMVVAFGLNEFVNNFRKNMRFFVSIFIIIIAMVSAFFYFEEYINHYRIHNSKDWLYEANEVARFLKENDGRYSRVVISRQAVDEAYIFVLFYRRYPPKEYQTNQNLSRQFRNNWYWVDRFDKYEFPDNLDWQKEKHSKNTLVLGTWKEFHPEKLNYVKVFNFLDGKPALFAVESGGK